MKMRVTHFRVTFSKTSETFLYAYITELEKQGVENHVVTFNRENKSRRSFSKVKVVNNEPGRWHPRRIWHRVRLFGTENASTRSFQVLIRKRMQRAIQRVNPDIIHAHFGPEAVRIAPLAKRLGIPLITTFYGYDLSQLSEEDDWREKYEHLWPLTDTATVLSKDMKEKAKNLGCPDRKLRVVHLARDLDGFEYDPPTQGVQSILFVGRLVAKKAPLDAIRAVELANKNGAELRLEMVGEGNLRERLEAYVREQGLFDQITLLGKLPNSEVAQRMKDSDAFILPSKTAPSGDQEGTPTVLVEAQASGLPCVSTRHAGIPEMIPEENQDLLAEEGDVEALADILKDLSSRDAEELVEVADRGRRKVKNEFDLSREVGKLRKIYSRHSAPVR